MNTFVGSVIVSGNTSPMISSWRATAIVVRAENLDEAVGKCIAYAAEQKLYPEITSDRHVDTCLVEVTSDSPITVVNQT